MPGIGDMVGSLAPYFGGGVNGGQPGAGAFGPSAPAADFAAFCRQYGISPPPSPGDPIYGKLMDAFIQQRSQQIGQQQAKMNQPPSNVGAYGAR